MKTFRLKIVACFILLSSLKGLAQDKITLFNGQELFGKVTEISNTYVKYYKSDEPGTPIRILNRSEVFCILYPNGTKDVFSNNSKTQAESPVYIINGNPVDNRFDPDSSDFAKKRRKRFDGPRFGFTYISNGTAADYLAHKGKQPLISQFGWQFEGRLFTVEDGLSGLLEFVPLIGGVEQGMFIPSANVLIGLRGGGKKSFEFAVGPNFSIVPNYLGNYVGSVGLVMAGGMSINKGNINFPVNLAFVPSVGSKEYVRDAGGNLIQKTFQTGWRLSLVVGFNSRKK